MTFNIDTTQLKPSDKDKLDVILKEIKMKGHSDSYIDLLKTYYEEIPVSIDEFLCNPLYLGKTTDEGRSVYPYWRNVLREILHGGKSYEEVIFSGAIGLGKSLNGDFIASYLLYKLLCMKNPQSFYGLAPNSPIIFAFLNIHKYLASGVAYGQFQNMLQSSPWFLKHGELRGMKNREYYPDKNLGFVVGADSEHVIGMNIFFAMLDEMSFAKKPNADILKAGIMNLYRSIKARMTSRFTQDGVLMAKAVLISSKRSDSDFLDQYAQVQRNDPKTYIVDEPQWVVKPKGTFSEETFRLAVGSKTKKSIIIQDNDPRTDIDLLNEGYTQVINPPLNLKDQFEFDMDAKLRDLAGISTTVFTKFISYDKLSRCYSKKLINPFENPTPIMGLEDGVQLSDYFNLDAVPQWLSQLPLYIHCDIGYSGDGYGIGCVANAGTKLQYSIQLGEQVTDSVYIHVFSAKVKAPKGDQVSLEKVRNFIYWLKFTCNWNIQRVSFDGFQSVDSRQQLITRGIPSDLISLDKTPNGYITYRTAVYEKRIAMIEIPMLEDELLNLERNEMTGKVDHPINGSKDASDGVAGACYNASMHQEKYSPIDESLDIFLSANEIDNRSNEEQNLVDQLSNKVRKDNKIIETPKITEDDDMDSIIDKVTRNTDEEVDQELTDEERNYYASMGILI